MYTTTNAGSEITDEIPLDTTPASQITESTFVFNTKITYEQTCLKIIRDWKTTFLPWVDTINP